MSTPIEHINTTSDEVLKALMQMVKDGLYRSADEVDDGQEMLAHYGLKTSMVQFIEGFVSKPLDSTYASIKTLSDSLNNMVISLVETFFISHADKIERAFISDETESPLFFFVVLKDDTLENRSTINEFFSIYRNFEFANVFPAYIQFVSSQLANKINPIKIFVA
jgi:hypothetical protein